MNNSYNEKYYQIMGEINIGGYISPEEEARKIEKCSLLKNVDITYSNNIEGYQKEVRIICN